ATVFALGYIVFALGAAPPESPLPLPLKYFGLISYLNVVVPLYVIYLVYHGLRSLEDLSKGQALIATVPLMLLFAPVYIGIVWSLLPML
ncbi:MAG: hypothetical protein SXQ77_13795, partial [Halobacteria archaeon]|nr:hypothetical protein [Halobacteria archaeon]